MCVCVFYQEQSATLDDTEDDSSLLLPSQADGGDSGGSHSEAVSFVQALRIPVSRVYCTHKPVTLSNGYVSKLC